MKQVDLNEKLLNPKEVAEFLGTSRRYVYQLIEQGTIKKVNLKLNLGKNKITLYKN